MKPYLCNIIFHGTSLCDQVDHHCTWNSAIK